jgi:hypothetical protein
MVFMACLHAKNTHFAVRGQQRRRKFPVGLLAALGDRRKLEHVISEEDEGG